MLWTLALVPVSLVGVWLAARHWYGWAISALSEVVWAAYALAIHSPSLLIMSGVWFVLHIRNTLRTYFDSHQWFPLWREYTAADDGWSNPEVPDFYKEPPLLPRLRRKGYR